MTENTTVKNVDGVKKPTRRKATPAIELVQPVETVEETELSTSVVEEVAPATTEDGRTIGIISVDNGGDNTKVLSETMTHPIHFKNQIAKGKPKDIDEKIIPEAHYHSHVVEWNNEVYLTNLRTAQSKFSNMTSYKESKTDKFFILSALLAVAKYGYDINYLCTCVPFKNFKPSEVQAIRDILIGEHTIRIDRVEYNFEIADVLVTAEAQAGHFYLQNFEYYFKDGGEVTLLEIGSRTVGFATFSITLDENGEISVVNFIREKSGTLVRKGIKISNVTTEEYMDYASSIYSDMSDLIDEYAKVVAFGGGVLIDDIKEGLQQDFKNIVFAEEPLYVQVRGMLVLAEEYFAEEDDE